jgi:hypothetical protein
VKIAAGAATPSAWKRRADRFATSTRRHTPTVPFGSLLSLTFLMLVRLVAYSRVAWNDRRQEIR